MKGEIFNLFEEFITEKCGEERYENILEEVQGDLRVSPPHVGPGSYPDEDFFLIVEKTLEELKMPLEESGIEFGKFMFPRLIVKIPNAIVPFDHPKEFLKTVNDILEIEVRKMYQHADLPKIEFHEISESEMQIKFHAKHQLLDIVEGLISGVSEYFSVPIAISRCNDGENCEEEHIFKLVFG